MSCKELKCSVCDKDLILHSEDGDKEKDKAYVGLSLNFGISDESERDFVQEQVGKYEVGKDYKICAECWLNALGVKHD